MDIHKRAFCTGYQHIFCVQDTQTLLAVSKTTVLFEYGLYQTNVIYLTIFYFTTEFVLGDFSKRLSTVSVMIQGS